MKKITFPLDAESRGATLTDLQQALLYFLDRGVYSRAMDDEGRNHYASRLREEHTDNAYGDATQKLVALFQEINRLEPADGRVDGGTAEAMNQLLQEWGLLEGASPSSYLVAGTVKSEGGLPLQNVLVRAFYEFDGAGIRLGEDTTDAEGRYTIRYEPLPYGGAINLRVSVISSAAKTLRSSDLIPNAKSLEIVNIAIPAAEHADTQHTLKGNVLFEDGRPADYLRLRLYCRKFGGYAKRLAKTTTFSEGQYGFAYKLDERGAILDIRALKQADSSLLSMGDVEDFVSLAAKLKDPADSVSRYLTRQFSVATNQALAEWPGSVEVPASLRETLIEALNEVIKGPLLWNEERFAHFDLREEVLGMVAQDLQNDELARLNRLLLEDAYPVELLEVPLSKTMIDLDEQTELNLAAPNRLRPLSPEYERLIKDLMPHIGEISKLADAKENHERQDITMLNRATGWDARVIALASISEKLGKDADLQLPVPAIYGLLRAGLPHDKALLAQLESDVVEQTLKTVRNAGIVALDDRAITATIQKFSANRDKIRLNLTIPGSGTTYGAMLRTSNLDDEKQGKFGRVFLDHRGSPEQLWQKAMEDAGLNSAQITGLKLQGKLAFLCGNNEQMTRALLAMQIHNPEELIEKGFYEAEQWRAEILTRAGVPRQYWKNLRKTDRDKLDKLILPAPVQEEIEDRLTAYAEDMARKLRLSYPTQVLAHRMENDDNFKPLMNSPAARELLRMAAGQGFRLGETLVDAFFDDHKDLASGKSESEFASAKQQIKMLHRLYQISTSDKAIPVLHAMKFSSAQDVAAVNDATFLKNYAEIYQKLYGNKPSPEEGKWIVNKSNQVSSIVYNLFTTARKMQSDFTIAGLSPSPEIRTSLVNSLIKQFPTMESLFGSMDYCECEHCRSVLSPAAYLVDLLQSLEEWGKPENLPAGSENPYEALIAKRPDIPYIALTCENTHTALPYIDIVNEILEYYINSDGRLTENAAHDTGKATTAELLAEPQNIIADAYEKLLDASYPLNLPFDLWIETVRQFCNYFDTPLDQLLETLRGSDQLFAPQQVYDRAAIFMESLVLSPEETKILTRADMLDKWADLYGFTDARATILDIGIETVGAEKFAWLAITNAEAAQFAIGDRCRYADSGTNALSNETKVIYSIGAPNSGGDGLAMIKLEGTWEQPPNPSDFLILNAIVTLTSAKQLARRLGTTYKEITEIIRGGFVNPHLPSLGLLYKLGIGISDARLYKDHKDFYNQYRDLVGKERNDLPPADQQRFDAMVNRVAGTPFTGWQIVNELYALEQKLLVFKSPAMSLDKLLTEIEHMPFDKILVLADPATSCDFDHTTLQYSNDSDAKPIDFLRINLFVRLWRKLGWTMEEVDRALSTFIPSEIRAGDDGAELARWFKTALIYVACLETLDKKLSLGKNSRIKLLTLWEKMATTGENPLYAQLFLTPGVLQSDPVFDHPLRHYLSSDWIRKMAEQRSYSAEMMDVKTADKISPALFAGELVEFSYDESREVQRLEVEGILSDDRVTALQNKLPHSTVLKDLLKDVQQQGKVYSLIKGHLSALQGALGLTVKDIEHILADVNDVKGLTLDNAPLTLENVSLLYRYGLLAKGIGLPISDLITLKQLSGCNPFTMLESTPLKPQDKEYSLARTLEFLNLVEEIKSSGLSIEDLDYLLCHRFVETGKYRPDSMATMALLRTIADGVRAIHVEHTLPEGPGMISAEVLHQKLGLAFENDVVDQLMKMMDGTAVFSVHLTLSAGEVALKPEDFLEESTVSDIYHDGTRNEQWIKVRLFDIDRNGIEDRHDSILLKRLLQNADTQARDFFNNYFCRQTVRIEDDAGFLGKGDFDELFAPFEKVKGNQKQQDNIVKRNQEKLIQRHGLLASSFLPFLQQRLIRQFVVQTLQAHTQAEPHLVERLLTDERFLGGDQPLLVTFESTGASGLTTTFYKSVNLTDAFGPPVVCPDADTGLMVKRNGKLEAIKPGTANSAKFEGYLTVPVSGAYRFFIEHEAATADAATPDAELHFQHLPGSRFLFTVSIDNDNMPDNQITDFLDLKAGMAYRFWLVIKDLRGSNVRLRVQSETLPMGSVSHLGLYPAKSMDAAERALMRLSKTLQLVRSLGLDEREIFYLLTHTDRFDGLNFNTLPTQSIEKVNGDLADALNESRKRFAWLQRLLGYTRLKRELAENGDKLIDIFEIDEITPEDKRHEHDRTYSRIATLTNRNLNTVKSAAQALFRSHENFSKASFFVDERRVLRLWQTLQLVERFGVQVEELQCWTRIVDIHMTQKQRAEIARSVKESIKARYETDAWQRVAKPIFDRLRQWQRDALVAAIMHQHRFARIEQLFEYFLMDPGMESVVQTSRIRLATASVQLFIQRCLLNLEPGVLPSAINSEHWEWMKRYRVWEANRKIFLFPENWLEPEFRDDKTHLFSELEGALLQGDVSSDLVEDAFLNYLKKLDELARLDIVAMHIEEDDANRTHRILHVFGRTFDKQCKYFYRRYDRQMWTPWEPVSVEISGDHLAPVIWRDRLYLFWVTFMDKPMNPDSNIAPINTELAKVDVNILMDNLKNAGLQKKIDVQLHWSEYTEGTWSPAAASGFVDDILGADSLEHTYSFSLNFDLKSIFVHVSKERDKNGSEGGVFIHLIGGEFNRSFYLAGRNAAPLIHLSGTGRENGKLGEAPDNPFAESASEPLATRYAKNESATSLKVRYRKVINDSASGNESVAEAILGKTGDRFNILPCNNVLTAAAPPAESAAEASEPAKVRVAIEASFAEILSLIKPVFYQDTQHTLFIEPTVTETTVEQWADWVPAAPKPDDSGFLLDRITNIPPIPVTNKPGVPSPNPLVKESLYQPITAHDPIINPVTLLEFDGALLGPVGRVDLQNPADVTVAGKAGIMVNINSEGAFYHNRNLIADDAKVLSRAGLQQSAHDLNIVGRTGLTAGLMQNLSQSFSSDFNLTGLVGPRGVML